MFIMDHQNGIITPERAIPGLGLGELYYSTCPVMIFPFSWSCSRLMGERGGHRLGAAFLCLVFGAALLLSGARADVLAALAVVLFFGLKKIRRGAGWGAALLTGVLIATAVGATVVPRFVNPQQGSNAIKLEHIHSYEEEFSTRPGVLLWGEGANSAFYTEGFQQWTTVTEVTYLELVRIFGLPMAALLCAGMLWIAWRLLTWGDAATGLAFLAYLGIAGSNPLLLNSTGFLVIGAAYVHALRCRDEIQQPELEEERWGRALHQKMAT
jgi:hypothetical protein